MDFCTGTLVDNFARHVRLYRKAKEKVEMNPSSDVCEAFFDFEAEFERGICRDEVCLDPEKEKGSFAKWKRFNVEHFSLEEFIRDLVEVLLYIVLPANDFRCVPAEKLLRVRRTIRKSSTFDLLFLLEELIVNFGFIRFIEIYSDPDVVNQLIISMVTNGLVFSCSTDRSTFSVSTNPVDHRQFSSRCSDDRLEERTAGSERTSRRGNESVEISRHRRRKRFDQRSIIRFECRCFSC